jgi:hypothetical protein
MATKLESIASDTCGNFANRFNPSKNMNERDFFNEKEEVKRASYVCPNCRERADYDVRWLKRTKKPQPPRGANEMDRARFQKSRDYLVRIDDMLACRNTRCRKRFEIPNSQSIVFI